jgi:hypothetical protein
MEIRARWYEITEARTNRELTGAKKRVMSAAARAKIGRASWSEFRPPMTYIPADWTGVRLRGSRATPFVALAPSGRTS